MSGNVHHLSVQSLSLRLGSFALRDVHLHCGPSEYHILLGPTGSGKSTLLKCILGFHKLAGGTISLLGRDITHDLPEQRKMGYVPQNYALFPHLNAEQNIRFGMKATSMTPSEADKEVDKLLGILGIDKLRGRRVDKLSGGERQKVALARALGIRPQTILFDEPFSAVDEGSKRGLWFDLKATIEELGITALHVTHNLEEAETLADKVSVLMDGELAQSGSRKTVFEHPQSADVARFLGFRNLFSGTAEPCDHGSTVNMGHFRVFVNQSIRSNDRVDLCIRQQDIKIVKPDLPIKDALQRNVFQGTVARLFPLIDHCIMGFRLETSPHDVDFELKFPRHIMERYQLKVGDTVSVAMWEPKIIIL